MSQEEVLVQSQKYPKTNFSGDLTEKARTIGFIEDCWAGPHGKQVRIQSTTTHHAQISLFDDHLGRYGCVGVYPSYNEQFSYYQWQLYVDLNASFGFVTEYRKNRMMFLTEISENGYEWVRIGSLADAEGWIGITFANGYPQPVLCIYNSNRQLLEWTQRTIGGDIGRSSHGYKLRLTNKRALNVLRRMPLGHREKVSSKELILRHADNGGVGLQALWEYRALRRKIEEEVRFVHLGGTPRTD